MKVMTILGTRPEIIRLSRVIARLEATPHIDHVLVHTGQNYDYELDRIFFEELELRDPHHVLAYDTSSVGRAYASVLTAVEDILLEEQPDAVLILGDTNSAIAAVIARRMHVPVFHMEAGNRSYDWSVPEEANRRIVDHISDVNMVYTEHARRNLLSEGVHPQRIYLTGSPMFEVLQHFRPKIDASNVLERQGLEAGSYVLVSLHREENVDDPDRLRQLLEAVASVGQEHDLRLLVSTHPRTRKRLEEFGLSARFADTMSFAKPFGFFDFNQLQLSASCTISDSGTVSEESAMLGFAAVTPRSWIERPEALDAGSIIMSGLDPYALGRAVSYAMETPPNLEALPPEYQVASCSDRVVRLLLGRDRRLTITNR